MYPIPVFDPREIRTASAEWALRMTIFPFLLCDLTIAINVHNVFQVFAWLSARSFDPPHRVDKRKTMERFPCENWHLVSKRQIPLGKIGINLLSSTVSWMDRRADPADALQTSAGFTLLPGYGPSSYGKGEPCIVDEPDINGFKIYTH